MQKINPIVLLKLAKRKVESKTYLSALKEEERLRTLCPSSIAILDSTKLPLKYSLSSILRLVTFGFPPMQSNSPNITELENNGEGNLECENLAL